MRLRLNPERGVGSKASCVINQHVTMLKTKSSGEGGQPPRGRKVRTNGRRALLEHLLPPPRFLTASLCGRRRHCDALPNCRMIAPGSRSEAAAAAITRPRRRRQRRVNDKSLNCRYNFLLWVSGSQETVHFVFSSHHLLLWFQLRRCLPVGRGG